MREAGRQEQKEEEGLGVEEEEHPAVKCYGSIMTGDINAHVIDIQTNWSQMISFLISESSETRRIEMWSYSSFLIWSEHKYPLGKQTEDKNYLKWDVTAH